MQQPMEAPTPRVVTEIPASKRPPSDGRVIAALPGLVRPGELPVQYVGDRSRSPRGSRQS